MNAFDLAKALYQKARQGKWDAYQPRYGTSRYKHMKRIAVSDIEADFPEQMEIACTILNMAADYAGMRNRVQFGVEKSEAGGDTLIVLACDFQEHIDQDKAVIWDKTHPKAPYEGVDTREPGEVYPISQGIDVLRKRESSTWHMTQKPLYRFQPVGSTYVPATHALMLCQPKNESHGFLASCRLLEIMEHQVNDILSNRGRITSTEHPPISMLYDRSEGVTYDNDNNPTGRGLVTIRPEFAQEVLVDILGLDPAHLKLPRPAALINAVTGTALVPPRTPG